MSDLEFTGGLDITEGLASVDTLASTAQSALETAFAASVSSFVDLITVAAETPVVLGVALDQAVAQVDSTFGGLDPIVNVGADPATGVTEVDTAFGGLDPVIPVNADASAIPSEIDTALSEISPPVVPVEADTTAALTTVADLASVTDATVAQITVDADTTNAVAAVDDLASSTDSLASSASSAQGPVAGLSGGAGNMGIVAGLAAGSMGAAGKGVDGLAGSAGIGLGPVIALSVGIGALVKAGIDGESAHQRFVTTLGTEAAAVQQVKVGTLNADLFTLGQTFGSTTAAMENATAKTVQFALNSGASASQATTFADGIAAISARAVALNPQIGTMSDVMEKAAIGIGKPRTALGLLNLSLDANEVKQRAATIATNEGKDAAGPYEKSVASLQLSLERFGPSLQKNITDGSHNAANEEKAMKAEFDNALESFGKSLVVPAFEALRAGIPIAEGVAKEVGQVADFVLPALAAVLGLIGPLIPPVVVGLLGFEAVGIVADVIGAISAGLIALGPAALSAGVDVSGAAAAIEGASLGIEAAAGPIGLVIGIAALAAGALGLFGDSAQAQDPKLKSFQDAVQGANGAMSDTAASAAQGLLTERNQMDDLARAGLNVKTVLDGVGTTTKAQRGTVDELAGSLKTLAFAQEQQGNVTSEGATAQQNYAKEVQGVRDHISDLIAKLQQENPALGDVLAQLQKQGELNPGLVKTILDLADAHAKGAQAAKDAGKAGVTAAQDVATAQSVAASSAQAAADGSGSWTTALKDQSDAAKSAGDELSFYSAQLKTAIGIEGDVTSASIGLAQSFQATADAVTKNGTNFSIFDKVGQDNIKTLESQVTSMEALRDATIKKAIADGQGSTAQAQGDAVLTSFTQHLHDQLAGYGLTDDAIAALTKSLGLTAPAADASQRAVDATWSAIVKLGRDTPAATAAINTGWGSIPVAAGAAMVATKGAVDNSGVPAASTTQAGQTRDAWNALNPLAGAVRGVFDNVRSAVSDSGVGGAAGVVAGQTYDAFGVLIPLPAQVGGIMGATKGAVDNSGIPAAASSAGSGAASGFQSGIAPVPDHAAQAVTDAGGKLTGAAASLAGQGGPAFTAGASVGDAFDQGIALGINLGTPFIVVAAANAVAAAEEAARAKAKATSPSQLFAALGRDLGEGLVVGLVSTEDRVRAASDGLVSKAQLAASVPISASVASGGAPVGVAGGGFVFQWTGDVIIHAAPGMTEQEANGLARAGVAGAMDEFKSQIAHAVAASIH